jgi:peptide/nickel transport system permease protein
MLSIVRRRLLVSIPLLLVVSMATFVFQSMVPGDPARTLLGVNATEEQYEALRQTMHLDDPLLVQYGRYVGGLFQGDLGQSIFSHEDVGSAIADRLPVTLTLMLGAVLVAALVGILLGVLSATRGRVTSRVTDVVSLLGSALPSFWVGLVLVSLFAIGLGWFPATGYVPFAEAPGQWLTFLVLPVVALALQGIAAIAKVTRDGMLTALDLDFSRTLRAAGVPERSLVWKHALRNSSLPIATMIGLTCANFVGGTILVESVFALPGLGSLVVDATNKQDIPVVQGVTLVVTALVILINLITDVLYGVLDPKVRVA